MLREVRVTIGEKTGSDLASRDVSISISLMNEAGKVLTRQCAQVAREESLTNPFNAAWMVGRAVRDLLLQSQ